MNRVLPLAFVLITVAVAACLRLPRLSLRPMHTDEAVHAVKLGVLLETGRYRYDPHEYHGPTLNALTLPLAWLRGQHDLRALDEVTCRLVPALAGILLVLVPWLLRDALGRRAAGWAMVLTALSPAFVYYSRYYIQEVLLVLFTGLWLACLWRYRCRPRVAWALGAGAAAGLMHATKETCVIAWGALILAGAIVALWEGTWRSRHRHWGHLTLGVGAAVLVSALLTTWGFTNPRGFWDSWATYAVYLGRGGQGEEHVHGWAYYLDLLTWIKVFEWPAWNEDLIVVGAALGLGYAVTRRGRPDGHRPALRVLALYTLLMTIVYAVLPYKTPWCMLGFLHGMILLAGVGLDRLVRGTAGIGRPCVLWGVTLLGVVSPLTQSLLQNFRYEADQTNPYVYAHTHRDVLRACETIQACVRAGGPETLVQVICPGDDYWPLPWYLRDLPRVGYWSAVDERTPVGDVIVTQPALEADVQRLVYERPAPGHRELFVPILDETTQLRHGVPLLAYARKRIWDRVEAAEGGP